MRRLGFRARLFAILFAFAMVPALALTIVWGSAASSVLPLLSASPAWDSVTATGLRAIEAVQRAPLTAEQRAALRKHEQELRASAVQALRLRYLASRAFEVVLVASILAVALLVLVTSRVAGHLSRQLSRPLAELVDWTGRIGRGEPLPDEAAGRGAPEFEVLRQRMRVMAGELALARERQLEASRAEAFRETARRVAHELKNPLTPIRFAVARLRRDAPPALAETVDVLETESRRLEEMARSFGQFGRLPEGPAAAVDVGDLVRYAAKSIVPETVPLQLEIAPDTPLIHGHYDALARALSNVLINAVEACQGVARDGDGHTGAITVHVRPLRMDGRPSVEIAVVDRGAGIAPELLPRIWDPYVTQKRGGTGLGLAIARQTIQAHGGEVSATSTVGQGTKIRFVLPVEAGE